MPPDGSTTAIRVCLLTLALLVAYHAAIALGWVPASDGNTLSADNRIRAERFVFRQKSEEPALVLVGSSMTGVLRSEFFRRPSANLGLLADCSLTGLVLVERTPPPTGSIILIEMNDTLTRGVDEEFVGQVCDGFAFSVRQRLPMFREEYRPSGVAITAAKRWKLARLSEQERAAAVAIDPALRGQVVAQRRATESRPMTPAEKEALLDAASRVRERVDALRRQGRRVVLFNLPTEPALDALEHPQEVRATLRRAFPPESYEWLPEPAGIAFETRDASHLTRRCAMLFAEHLENAVFPHDRAP